LTILVAESERISRLINQVLDIEKIQSDAAPLRLEPLDMVLVLQGAILGMGQLFAEKGVGVAYGDGFRHWLAQPTGLLALQADKDRLTQVVVNLLSNALKFCDPEKGEILIDLSKTERFIRFSVRDNGAGIPAGMQQMIFEKFTQLHSNTLGKPQGTGLGLFITRSIVEQHGGTIRVESEPGKGATFEVSLPV
jgi:signal transduction histidine kinase